MGNSKSGLGSVYEATAKNLAGTDTIAFDRYRGKVLLVVNGECGVGVDLGFRGNRVLTCWWPLGDGWG